MAEHQEERDLPAGGVPDGLGLTPAARAGIRILIVDDDRTLREGCASVLRAEGYAVTVLARGDEAIDLVRHTTFDIIVCDVFMTPVSGMEVLRSIVEAAPRTIVVMITGNPSVESSVETLRAGAWDYLPKPFSGSQLLIMIGRAAHAVLVAREADAVHSQLLRDGGNSDKVTILGVSPAFRRVIELARRVATTDASVMITGESGTGKEVIAQLIHRHSRRASRNLVAINCAALPEPLLESEMFGHRKGAFTGADRDKPGLLEVANGGTLFLDELTEMSHTIQAKLLRVIQDGVVRRVGSEHENAVVDVRFITATNKDPQEAAAKGVLREDLFYRLAVVPIRLPSLRDRPEDIPLLATHFLAHYWTRHRGVRLKKPQLSDEAMAFLRARPWRGNVRELQNVLEHLAVLAEPNQVVRPADLPLAEMNDGARATTAPHLVLDEGYHVAKDRLLTQFEREYLTALVRRAGGNMSRAARLASIDRTTLYRLLEKYGMQQDQGGREEQEKQA